jgi:hypothetical protein
MTETTTAIIDIFRRLSPEIPPLSPSFPPPPSFPRRRESRAASEKRLNHKAHKGHREEKKTTHHAQPKPAYLRGKGTVSVIEWCRD